MEVFADNISTTKTLPSVLEESLSYLDEKFGLMDQSGGLARESAEAVSNARKSVARFLGVKTGDIFFFPSVQSFLSAMLPVFLSRDGSIVQPKWLNMKNLTSPVESVLFDFVSAVPGSCDNVNAVIYAYRGGLEIDDRIEEFAGNGVPVAVDISLAVSRTPLSVRQHNWHYALIDGNLVYGLDGACVVYASEKSFLRECGLLDSAMPSGRVSVASAVGIASSLEFVKKRIGMEEDKLRKFEIMLNNDFSDNIENAEIVTDNKIPGIVSLKVSDMESEILDKYLEDKLGIYVDTRQSGDDTVLTIALGIYTEMEDVEMLGDMIPAAITNVRRGITE